MRELTAVVAQRLLTDEQLHFWGEFFTQAQLFPFLTFEEFLLDPDGIVAELTDPDAPPSPAFPVIRRRIAERLKDGRSPFYQVAGICDLCGRWDSQLVLGLGACCRKTIAPQERGFETRAAA